MPNDPIINLNVIGLDTNKLKAINGNISKNGLKKLGPFMIGNLHPTSKYIFVDNNNGFYIFNETSIQYFTKNGNVRKF